MITSLLIDENNIDDHIDDQIAACLKLEKPTSFFLFAGAGSGKTRSLENALKYLQKNTGKYLRLRGQRIGVITYTNAACDEIKQRLFFDPLIEISTIHSFAWSLIKKFHTDIKYWLSSNLEDEINELTRQQIKGRTGTKAAIDRENSINLKTQRLSNLAEIKSFTYSPNGDNRGRDSLNHSEVIKIATDFLIEKQLMQSLLASRFPILFIDESQDTNKSLMEAFLRVQAKFKDRFILGLFGDMMQQIYSDGMIDLGQNLPDDWAKPEKKMNHRCPRRVIKLINKIRSAADNQKQIPRTDKEEGFVRLYILPNNTMDKQKAEQEIAKKMAEVTQDHLWNTNTVTVKTLILEHHMAATRMGFLEMFEPLYKIDTLKTSLINGTLSGIRLFSNLILPIVKAKQRVDNFAVASIIHKHSPLLSKALLKTAGVAQLKKAHDAVEILYSLWLDGRNPSFLEVLHTVYQTGLFEIPSNLSLIMSRSGVQQQKAKEEISADTTDNEQDNYNEELDAWDKFLMAPFKQIENYVSYINQQANFYTHQGVKGLEFSRVMVIIDDSQARGFLFSYEKLFGAKEKSKTDLDNEHSGKDTSIERTRRLFYVTCSRTEKSLAIIAYSENPAKIREHVISQGWFQPLEVELMI